MFWWEMHNRTDYIVMGRSDIQVHFVSDLSEELIVIKFAIW